VPGPGRGIGCGPGRAHSRGMIQHELAPVPARGRRSADQLDRAVATYLTRLAGTSRAQICAASCPGVPSGSCIRWWHSGRIWSCTSGGYRKSAASSHPRFRRFWVVAGFYRTAVIEAVLDHSPAEHVRRPAVPPESPTLGFTPTPPRRRRRRAHQPYPPAYARFACPRTRPSASRSVSSAGTCSALARGLRVAVRGSAH